MKNIHPQTDIAGHQNNYQINFGAHLESACEALSSSETFSQGQSGNGSFTHMQRWNLILPVPIWPLSLSARSKINHKDSKLEGENGNNGNIVARNKWVTQFLESWRRCDCFVQTSCCFWWRVLICGKANKNQFYMRGRVEIKGFCLWLMTSIRSARWLMKLFHCFVAKATFNSAGSLEWQH